MQDQLGNVLVESIGHLNGARVVVSGCLSAVEVIVIVNS